LARGRSLWGLSGYGPTDPCGLTGRLLTDYLSGRVYTQLQAEPGLESERRIDNPDQCTSQHVDGFTSESLRLTVEVIDALLTFACFLVVLWSISVRLVVLNGAQLWLERSCGWRAEIGRNGVRRRGVCEPRLSMPIT
jgi:ABC-type uncharacterized transport system fused permease/ATPase subunit